MRKSLFVFFSLFLIGLVMVPSVRAQKVKFLGEDVDILPLKDVKPGMIGYGLSVFKGLQPERFEVKIEAVVPFVKNKYIIWARAWGGPDNIVSRAGIIAGMSGSPIYLQDPADKQWKLIGALAYGYLLQPASEAQAGITPIEEMINNLQNLLVAYYGPGPNQNQGSSEFLLDPSKVRIPLRLIGNKKAVELFRAETKKQFPFDFYESEGFETGNLAAVKTSFHANQQNITSNNLQAGDAVAVALSTGDLALAAVGTVTLSNSRGFLAFGHPFFRSGFSNIPVFRTEIGMIVPSYLSSFKENTGIVEPQLGLIVVDGLEGILGVWHNQSTIFPLNVNFHKNYLNNVQTDDQWAIGLAQHTPLGSQIFVTSILYAIILGSPDLNNLSFDIRVDFIYKDQGVEQTLSISKSFFSKKGEGIQPSVVALENVYKMFEKARKELVRIDAYVTVTQEKGEVLTMFLSDVDTEKTSVQPKEKITLGLMLSDKYRTYSQIVKFKAPDFQGEVVINIQDGDRRLQELTNNALEDSSKINEVFDFVRTSFNKKNVFYVVIKHVKSIAERKGSDNNGWKVAIKRTEEVINKEIIEVELPQISEKFNVSISAQKKITVVKINSDKEEDKDKNKD
jgi:hypothetical protein